MPLDKSLILSQNKKQNAPKNPVLARRNRLIMRIRVQIELAQREIASDLPVRNYRRLARWWWQDGKNYFLSIQYCRRPLELAKGRWSIQCADVSAVIGALKTVENAILAGEYDAQLIEHAEKVRANFKAKAA